MVVRGKHAWPLRWASACWMGLAALGGCHALTTPFWFTKIEIYHCKDQGDRSSRSARGGMDCVGTKTALWTERSAQPGRGEIHEAPVENNLASSRSRTSFYRLLHCCYSCHEPSRIMACIALAGRAFRKVRGSKGCVSPSIRSTGGRTATRLTNHQGILHQDTYWNELPLLLSREL